MNAEEATKPDVSSMGIKALKAELNSYGLSTESFLDKESLVDAVKKAREDGLESERLIDPNMEDMAEEQGEVFVCPVPMNKCSHENCPGCDESEPMVMWRYGEATYYMVPCALFNYIYIFFILIIYLQECLPGWSG